ncbi:hypothetical protein Tco_0304632 [Tanacetum coccineum]
MVVMSVTVLIWERDSRVPNVMEKGELRCDSGDWDRDGDSDVIGGGGRLEICRSEMVVVQKRKKKEKF